MLETDSKNAEAVNLVSSPSMQSHCYILVLSAHCFPIFSLFSTHPNQICTCVSGYPISFLPLSSSHPFLSAFIVFFPLLHSLLHLHSLFSSASFLPHPFSISSYSCFTLTQLQMVDSASLYYDKMEKYIGEEDYRTAHFFSRKFLELCPGSTVVLLRAAEILMHDQKYDDAGRICK